MKSIAVFPLKLAIVALAALMASACIYNAPIQQGNLLEVKDIDQVTVGMTQAQVRYVLGTPMVADSFTTNRWDYLYYIKTSKMPEPKKQQFTVYFDNGNVTKTERIALGTYKAEPEESNNNKPWYKRWLGWII